nr:hypothetical protein CFP56_09454 [Quercus suber]
MDGCRERSADKWFGLEKSSEQQVANDCLCTQGLALGPAPPPKPQSLGPCLHVCNIHRSAYHMYFHSSSTPPHRPDFLTTAPSVMSQTHECVRSGRVVLATMHLIRDGTTRHDVPRYRLFWASGEPSMLRRCRGLGLEKL